MTETTTPQFTVEQLRQIAEIINHRREQIAREHSDAWDRLCDARENCARYAARLKYNDAHGLADTPDHRFTETRYDAEMNRADMIRGDLLGLGIKLGDIDETAQSVDIVIREITTAETMAIIGRRG